MPDLLPRYKRKCFLTVGFVALQSPPMTIEFENTFSSKGSPQTTVWIYNPSEITIDAAAPLAGENQPCLITAGYGLDVGSVVIGEIFSHKVNKKGTEKILELKIGDITKKYSSARVSKSFGAFATSTEIILSLTAEYGVIVGNIIPGVPKIYPGGMAFHSTLKDALEKMAKEVEADFFFKNGRLYFMPKEFSGNPSGVLITPLTGMLGHAEKTKIGYKIKNLFEYRIGAGDMVVVQSDDYNGTGKVIKGKHSFKESKAITNFEIKTLI
jgi:hypothetical protein